MGAEVEAAAGAGMRVGDGAANAVAAAGGGVAHGVAAAAGALELEGVATVELATTAWVVGVAGVLSPACKCGDTVSFSCSVYTPGVTVTVTVTATGTMKQECIIV